MVRRICVLLAAVGAAVALASPASAGTRSVPDPRGDAVAAVDFTKVKVTNGKKAVRVRVVIPRFRRSKAGFVSVTVSRKAKGLPFYQLSREHRRNAWTKPRLVDEAAKPIRCRGDRVRFRSNGFVARIPQRCIDDNRKKVVALPTTFARDFDVETDFDAEPYPYDVPDRRGRWVRYR
ncbi:hypothetical protein CLV56_0490 [Mumia flava]|uniref:Uncharacterized protein n=1 Tax=Mumia flava TaxID=1348852 RepID=A0A0B2BH38_9ACTN|nr:hypothetical protein [Mumia flava]PJJ56285.1 hypothetical protein CLV56_0490 [Mumia flava]